jgi:hypothetical protein
MFKSISIKAALLLGGFAAVTLSSCLKDDLYDQNKVQSVAAKDGTTKIIELGVTGTSNSNFMVLAFNSSNTDTTFNLIPVTLASSEPAPEDINVTLEKNDAIVDAYNNDNGTAYTVPSSNMYTVLNPGGVVTIPKGSNTGYLKIKIKPNDFIGTDWALGYKIKSVDKAGYFISGNLNQAIVAIAIKNKYDGHYRVTGTMVDATNPAITGAQPIEVDLETLGSNSVVLNPTQGPFAGAYLYPILNAGSGSGYGSFSPVFTFDANDNIISVTNVYGQPAANGRSGELDPSGVNKWFASDKHIEVKYWMNQPGTTHRSSMNEKFTYLRPR